MKNKIDSSVSFKPKIKYKKSGGIKYKCTRIVRFKGPAAKALALASDKGTYWSFDDKKLTLDVYAEEMLEK